MTAPWIAEHGEQYDVPAEILNMEAVEDNSWHNNTCPCFGVRLDDPSDGDTQELSLWVEHPDPFEREYQCGPRFMVTYMPWSRYIVPGLPRSDNGQAICETDDVREAIRALVDASATLHRDVRARS